MSLHNMGDTAAVAPLLREAVEGLTAVYGAEHQLVVRFQAGPGWGVKAARSKQGCCIINKSSPVLCLGANQPWCSAASHARLAPATCPVFRKVKFNRPGAMCSQLGAVPRSHPATP